MSPLIILIFLPLFLSTDLVIEEQYVPKNYTFYDHVEILDEKVHIFFIKSWEDFPVGFCQKENVVGCAIYGEYSANYIYMTSEEYTDEFGMSTFEHEVAHIKCKCDFHKTPELREHLKKQDYVFEYIIDNKEKIKLYLELFT